MTGENKSILHIHVSMKHSKTAKQGEVYIF